MFEWLLILTIFIKRREKYDSRSFGFNRSNGKSGSRT